MPACWRRAATTRRRRAFLAQGPQSADIYNLRAALAAQANDKKTLAGLYRQLQKSSGEIREGSAFLLGQLAEMQGLKADALDWYDQVGDDDPHAFDADLRSAVILHAQGKKAEAHELLGQLETAYLDQPERAAQGLRGRCRPVHGRAALSAGRDGIQSGACRWCRTIPALLYGRGLAYAEAGKIDQAVTDLRRLLQLKPNDVDAANALGYTLADANRDLPEAERLIKAARDGQAARSGDRRFLGLGAVPAGSSRSGGRRCCVRRGRRARMPMWACIWVRCCGSAAIMPRPAWCSSRCASSIRPIANLHDTLKRLQP